MIAIKRAYEAVSKNDGFRVLIDRLWPRGIKKEKLALDAWFKELAPSTALRKEFGHALAHWETFQTKYKKELQSESAQQKIEFIKQLAQTQRVTLIYGAREKTHNNATVLKEIIEKESLP